MGASKLGERIIVFEVYAMFLLTGAACVSIGTSLLHLSRYFEITISHAAILASAMALGRVSTVFISSMITERFGSKFSLTLGIILLALFCLGIPVTKSFVLAAVSSVLGGIGQGLHDSSSPVILQHVFKKNYHRAVSMTQVFFGIGSFITPLVFSLLLLLGMRWQLLYYGLFVLALVMISAMLFVKMPLEGGLKPHKEGINLSSVKENISMRVIVLFILLTFTYTAVINTVYTYTAAYNINLGLNESVSVTMLTMFSIGTIIGSLVFTMVLKYFTVTGVLFFNCIASFLIFCFIKSVSIVGILLSGYFVFGSLFGVIYSLLVSTSTEMMPKRASFAAAMVAFFSGSADILSPLVTGRLVDWRGIKMSFQYAFLMGLGMVAFVTVFYFIYRKAETKSEVCKISSNEEA